MFNRRDFLKTSVLGAGAIALPPSLQTLAAERTGNQVVGSQPKRFIFIRKSNGAPPHHLVLPSFSDAQKAKEAERLPFEVELAKHELPVFLQELSAYKDELTILQGLSAKMSINGHNSWHSVMGLCKAKYGAISTLKRASIDFELAKLFPSPLGHVELSFAGDRHGIVPGFSIPSPFQTNYCYADPITAYENLFKCVLKPDEMQMDNIMLAYLQQREAAKLISKSSADKRAYEVHAESVGAIRSNNKQLTDLGAKIAKHLPDREFIYDKGSQSSASVDRQDAMTEVMVGLLESGLVNVVTYTIDDLDTKQTGLPGIPYEQVGLHKVGHHGSYGGMGSDKIRELIGIQHVKQVKTIVERLKAQPEGNGTMFDNTMVMYFPEGGEAHHAQGTESPWVIISGRNMKLDMAGRYIRMPYYLTEGHQTLGNWYTTLLNAHGNSIPHYGDLDPAMSRKKLPQEGPIKQLLKA